MTPRKPPDGSVSGVGGSGGLSPATGLSRERQIEIADWMVETCLTHGTSVHTAFLIAGWFIEVVEVA